MFFKKKVKQISKRSIFWSLIVINLAFFTEIGQLHASDIKDLNHVNKSGNTAQNLIIIGLQFGDESKGSITDVLSKQANAVVRYNGGNNAGHTIVIDGKSYKLSVIPSGILQKDVTCFLGTGMVLSLDNFMNEIEKLKNNSIEVSPINLKIANNIPLVLPLHIETEALAEKTQKLNTTKKGIGPAYEDKVGRRAIRVGDLLNLDDPQNLKSLEEKIDKLIAYHNALRKGYDVKELLNKNEIINYLKQHAPNITPYIADVPREIQKMQQEGKKLLIEGAQSCFLDVNFGTYPYVTSSATFATAAAYAMGVRLKNEQVLGVIKAYTTRVGNGPFPTLLQDEIGKKIGEIGKEFGAVTGRKRDCGWLDLVAVKEMVNLNQVDYLALAKGDVLDDFDIIKVCIAYEIDGKIVDKMPYEPGQWTKIKPIYKEFKGWKNTKSITSFDDLDSNYIEYIKFIEEFTGIPVVIISTGPGREEKIMRTNPFMTN